MTVAAEAARCDIAISRPSSGLNEALRTNRSVILAALLAITVLACN
jgi:hypothetical protein